MDDCDILSASQRISNYFSISLTRLEYNSWYSHNELNKSDQSWTLHYIISCLKNEVWIVCSKTYYYIYYILEKEYILVDQLVWSTLEIQSSFLFFSIHHYVGILLVRSPESWQSKYLMHCKTEDQTLKPVDHKGY